MDGSSFVKTEWGSFNTDRADQKTCDFCKKLIELAPYIDERGRFMIDRENRIDCECDGSIVSYHLDCYDLAVFGEVLASTVRQMAKWRDRYDARAARSPHAESSNDRA